MSVVYCGFSPSALDALARGELDRSLAGCEVRYAARSWSNLVSTDVDERMEGAEIVFGQPQPDRVLAVPTIRWVQLTSAGWARYDDESTKQAFAERGVQLTTSSSVYADPCAEHILAMMLANNRRLPQALRNQLHARTWPDAATRRASDVLHGQSVVILGFGAIARRLSELLVPFDCRVTAVRRRPRGDEPVSIVDEAGLDALLPDVRHLVSTLPGTPSTRAFVSRARLSRLPPGAFFYNVGRGATVDQAALVEVLTSGHLAGAYLDVTDPEPLPREHPLWDVAFITPHSAGGRAGEMVALVRHFATNLARFRAGTPLSDRVI